MTVDEEYKGCRNCKYQPEPLQTCDWIKHQKEIYRVCPMWELRESEVKIITLDKTNFLDGYNKALYDFVYACKENIMCKTFGLRECDIEKIAEQLKAGGENE